MVKTVYTQFVKLSKVENQNIEFKQSWRDEYMKIIVNKYPFPVSYHGKYYKRSGSTLQELSGVELDKMILYVQGRTWDSVPVPNVQIDELENDAFRLFRKKATDSPNLANVFFKCGMIESWGRGFEKIVSYCKEENAKTPEIDLSLGGVTARCFASGTYLNLMEEHKEEFKGANEGLNLSAKENVIYAGTVF